MLFPEGQRGQVAHAVKVRFLQIATDAAISTDVAVVLEAADCRAINERP